MKSYYIVSIVIVLVVCVGTPLVVTGSYYLCESMPFIEAARQREEEAKQELKRAEEIAEERREERRREAEEREQRKREEAEAAERHRKEEAAAAERRRKEETEAAEQRKKKETTIVEQRKQNAKEKVNRFLTANDLCLKAFSMVDRDVHSLTMSDLADAGKMVNKALAIMREDKEYWKNEDPLVLEAIANQAQKALELIEIQRDTMERINANKEITEKFKRDLSRRTGVPLD